MDYVETEGETIDEAIDNALRILGVERDKVTLDILAEGSRGIFGIGAKKARVQASLRKVLTAEQQGPEVRPPQEEKISRDEVAAVGQKGKEVLAEILRLMGIKATIEVKLAETGEEVLLNVYGENGGLLIGRRGQTLEALQYLVTRALSESQPGDGLQLIVDTENYRDRRRKLLEDMALRLGEKAKRERKAVAAGTLSAADRRIIRLALEDDPWLTTKSLGKGPYRRLLIIPEGDRKKKDEEKPQSPTRQEPKGQR